MPSLQDGIRSLRMRSMYSPVRNSRWGAQLKPSFEEIQNMEAMIRQEQESRQGRQFREKFHYDQIARNNEHNRQVDSTPPMMSQLAQRVAKPEQDKPMDVIFRDSISPYQQAQLSQRDKDRESREKIAGERTELAGTKQEQAALKDKGAANDRERRTKVLETKASQNTLTDKEKIELAQLGRIAAIEKTQIGAMDRVNRTGELAGTRQEDAQKFTTDRDVVQQGNALDRITATGNNATERQINQGDITSRQIRERAALDSDKPQSSTQEKTAIQLRYNKLLNEQPELRDFIELDEDGMPVIDTEKVGGAFGMGGKTLTPMQLEEIKKKLYGGARTSTPTTAARPDPLGIRPPR